MTCARPATLQWRHAARTVGLLCVGASVLAACHSGPTAAAADRRACQAILQAKKVTRRLVHGSTGNDAAALNAERPILDRRFGSAARGAHSPEVRNLALAVLLQPVGPDHPVVALARCQALGASVGGPRLLPVDHRNALLGLFVEPPTMHMTVTVTAGPSRPPPVVITTGTATLLLHAGRYNLTAVAVPTLTCRYTVTVPAGDQTGLQLTIGDPPACHNMTPTAEPPQHVSTTVVGRTP